MSDPEPEPEPENEHDALAVTAKAEAEWEVIPGASFGRFVMRAVIGHGGMGVVIEAYDPDLDRKVALKLIHPDAAGGDTARQRLQQEAQAMARLAHPNVVTVYEVGLAADQLFIAMELVGGATLKDWLAAPRGWRELVAAYLAAGRGLEAAHRAGLTHRDFKPENVMIGSDGRPRVGDFGLAVLGHGRAASAAGTPAYMSPEQWSGGEVDARSDQFAFCAAVWRAVYGEGPFAGATVETLKAAVLGGELRAAPPGHRAPRWLERLLSRGLAREPSARWPDLGALLDALAARLAVRRRATWIAAGASGIAAIAIAVAVIGASREAADPCVAPVERAGAVWGGAPRSALEHHLLAIDPGLGSKRFAAIAAVLDRGTAGWVDAHVAACRATRVDGGQSDTLLDLRTRCLDGWLGRVASLVTELGRVADPKQLDAAIEGLASLGVVERCADTALLEAVAAPPVDPRTAVEVRALDGELAAIRAGQRTGALPALAARADAALARARRIGHPPALADALALRAQLAESVADTPTAIALLRELPEVAARARDDERAAASWATLIRLVGEHLGRPGEARAMMPAARAASARVGDPPLLFAQVLAEEGHALSIAGDSKTALADLGRARDVLEAAGAARPGSPAGPLLIGVLHSLGTAYRYARELEPAVATLRREIALADAVYGPDTLSSAAALLQLGEVLRDLNQLADADRVLREAIRIREARTGQSPALAIALSSLAEVTHRRERPDEAAAIGERALAVARATMAPSEPLLATIIAPVADSYDEAGHTREALALYDEVFAIVERANIDTINVAAWLFNRADLLRKLGRCADAVADLERAAAIAERFQGARSPMAGSATHGAGECLHELHRDAEAIAALERSQRYQVLDYQAEYAGQGRGLLGQLLIATGRDPARGAALIREARARLRQLGSKHADDFRAPPE